jgi:hypothetical protein
MSKSGRPPSTRSRTARLPRTEGTEFPLEVAGFLSIRRELAERGRPALPDGAGAALGVKTLRSSPSASTNLAGANLSSADFNLAYLGGANLQRANLNRANLYDADLRNADLRGADLRDTDHNEKTIADSKTDQYTKGAWW